MNKTAVIYKSRFGSTKRYARWVAAELGADLIPFYAAIVRDMSEYDTIVYGAYVYSGIIQGIRLLQRPKFQNKRIIVFAVGLTQPGDEGAFGEVLRRTFIDCEKPAWQFYHFPGCINYKKLPIYQRSMMRLLKKAIKNKPQNRRTGIEQYILDYKGKLLDFTNQEYIRPMTDMLKQQERYDAAAESGSLTD